MSRKLPHSQLNWISKNELETLDPLDYNEKSDYGYVLEVKIYINDISNLLSNFCIKKSKIVFKHCIDFFS